METIIKENKSRPIDHVCATHWPTYIKQAIKTGLESPTPYKVIPYKNGIGIKKIEFIKPKKQAQILKTLFVFIK